MSGEGGEDARHFVSVAGTTLFLVGGILGVGLAYTYFSNREPKPGQKVLVCPEHGRTYTGPWRGVDEWGGMSIGSQVFDPEDLEMVGPLKHGGRRDKPYSYIDLNSGFVHPSVLQRLVSAHNRDGYNHRVKGNKTAKRRRR